MPLDLEKIGTPATHPPKTTKIGKHVPTGKPRGRPRKERGMSPPLTSVSKDTPPSSPTSPEGDSPASHAGSPPVSGASNGSGPPPPMGSRLDNLFEELMGGNSAKRTSVNLSPQKPPHVADQWAQVVDTVGGGVASSAATMGVKRAAEANAMRLGRPIPSGSFPVPRSAPPAPSPSRREPVVGRDDTPGGVVHVAAAGLEAWKRAVAGIAASLWEGVSIRQEFLRGLVPLGMDLFNEEVNPLTCRTIMLVWQQLSANPAMAFPPLSTFDPPFQKSFVLAWREALTSERVVMAVLGVAKSALAGGRQVISPGAARSWYIWLSLMDALTTLGGRYLEATILVQREMSPHERRSPSSEAPSWEAPEGITPADNLSSNTPPGGDTPLYPR